MRRFLRRLLTFAAAASAVLCVGVVVLWIHSLDRADSVSWARWEPDGTTPAARVWWAGGVDGRLFVSAERLERVDPWLRGCLQQTTPAGVHTGSIDCAPLRSVGMSPHALWGMERPFAATTKRREGPGLKQVVYEAHAPGWAVAGAAAVPPLLWVAGWDRRRRARRRSRRGLCRRCGYDLRATPADGGALLRRCPECGAVPSGPAAGQSTDFTSPAGGAGDGGATTG